jgi:hypothetical protein
VQDPVQIDRLNVPLDALNRHVVVEGGSAAGGVEDVHRFLRPLADRGCVHPREDPFLHAPGLAGQDLAVHAVGGAVEVELSLVGLHGSLCHLQVSQWRLDLAFVVGVADLPTR